MRSLSIPVLLTSLMAACSAGPAAEEPAPGTPGAVKYFGKMSYDGIHLAITGCDGRMFWLEDELFDGSIGEIKKIKADPNYAVWIQVETDVPVAPDPNGRPTVLKSGTLGSTHKDPCPK